MLDRSLPGALVFFRFAALRLLDEEFDRSYAKNAKWRRHTKINTRKASALRIVDARARSSSTRLPNAPAPIAGETRNFAADDKAKTASNYKQMNAKFSHTSFSLKLKQQQKQTRNRKIENHQNATSCCARKSESCAAFCFAASNASACARLQIGNYCRRNNRI